MFFIILDNLCDLLWSTFLPLKRGYEIAQFMLATLKTNEILTASYDNRCELFCFNKDQDKEQDQEQYQEQDQEQYQEQEQDQ